MTTTILEQMALALADALDDHMGGLGPTDGTSVAYIDIGEVDLAEALKAALQPLLGELPEGVAKAGGNKHSGNDYFSPEMFPEEAQAIFHAMISAILEDQPTTTGEG